MFFGPYAALSLAEHARQVGLACLAAKADAIEAIRTAGQRFADFVKVARLEAMGRVMADAAAQAKTPAVAGLVQEAAGKAPFAARPGAPASAARPASPVSTPAKPASPEEAKRQEAAKRRQRNIEEDVPGVYDEDSNAHVENDRPAWSVDPQFEKRPVPGLPEREYKFYRRIGDGRRVR